MSINHFSPDFSDTLWWTQHHQNQNQNQIRNQSILIEQTSRLNTNKRLMIPQINGQDEHAEFQERESMFEKHLTPSDVGKLNRLVIPKQHAEKYFPMNNNNNNNSNINGNSNNNTNNNGNGGGGDRGLLLSFDDEAGKCWRFRYSYWNSSQSYVLTKGWSRYVKEKRLDAGDVVLFERDRVELDRFFIGWRRRAAVATEANGGGDCSNGGASGGAWSRVVYSAHPYPSHPFPPYQPDCLHAGPTVQAKTAPPVNSKRVRLFGVNLECQIEEQTPEPPTPEGSSMSSQGQTHEHNFYYPEPQNYNQMVRHSY